MIEYMNKWKKIEGQQNRYVWKPENFPDLTLQNREKYENEVAFCVTTLKLKGPNALN